MLKIILDTSTILTTFISQNNNHSGNILKMAFKKEIKIVSSPDIFLELQQKAASPKIKNHSNFKPKKVAQFLAWYKYNTMFFEFEDDLNQISRDKNDDKFLLLAKYSEADFLITLDKDLLVIANFYNTKILNPKDFIQNFKTNNLPQLYD